MMNEDLINLYEKFASKAKIVEKSVKDYLNDDKNIHHISLVFYDLLPLVVKIGLRYEKFDERFNSIFKKIRNGLYITEPTIFLKSSTKNPIIPVVERDIKPIKSKRVYKKRTLKK